MGSRRKGLDVGYGFWADILTMLNTISEANQHFSNPSNNNLRRSEENIINIFINQSVPGTETEAFQALITYFEL